MARKPNVVYVFSDQHRSEATGYNSNPDVLTPTLDALSKKSIDFKLAVSNTPCCCPYRATLMTGQYPQSHGVFVNDVHLNNDATSIADAFTNDGYDTAYIGKWHLNGRGRSQFIPKENRQGFDYWRVLECTHNYNQSFYYGDENIKRQWEGYDVFAQTNCAKEYIRSRKEEDKPFFLVLSWGMPHNPYGTAPEKYKQLYDPREITLRPNVPPEYTERTREDLAGYYSHITALDSSLEDVWNTLIEEGIEEDTIFIYTSDHGDMLGSQGMQQKQKPWDESIRVPFLMSYPSRFGTEGKAFSGPFNSPDIMPTLLGLCDIPIPDTVEGENYASYLLEEKEFDKEGVLIQSMHPSGEWHKGAGGVEYRGVRTTRYTYVRDINGPWLLFDNDKDQYQLHNYCNHPSYIEVQQDLEQLLKQMLERRKDEFLEGYAYLQQWGYIVDETGTVPYN